MAGKKHDCRWRDHAAKLEQKLSERDAQLVKLTERVNQIEHKLALANKQIVGPKSERMPTPEQEAKKREGHKPPRGGYTNPKKRRENAEAMASLPATIVPHPVPDAQRRCRHCGEEISLSAPAIARWNTSGSRGASSAASTSSRWVAARASSTTPEGPHHRACEGCTYGPAFLAKLAVDKCADATPIYRVEKAMRRAGIPLSRSTMNALVLLTTAPRAIEVGKSASEAE